MRWLRDHSDKHDRACRLGRQLGGCGAAVYITFDGSGWDGSLTETLLRCTELPGMQEFSTDRRFRRALLRGVGRLKIRHVATRTTVNVDARRRSGDTYTSIGNAMVNVQLQIRAWAEATGLSYAVLESLLMIEGDDAGIHLPVSVFDHIVLECYRDLISAMGILPKSHPFPCWGAQGEQAGTFCSNVFYKDDGGVPRSMLIVERSLKKFMFTVKTMKVEFGQLAVATIRSRLLVNARTPIVRELGVALCRYDSEVKLTSEEAIDEDMLRKLGLSARREAVELLGNDGFLDTLPMYGDAEVQLLYDQWGVSKDTILRCIQEIVEYFSGGRTEMRTLHCLMKRL
eukprot:68744-Amphidinium_carterae.1